MQLKTLLATTPVRQVFGSVDRPVENIAYDSRRVQRHTLFVALRGEKTDGHQFIGHAIEGRRPSFFKDVQFLLTGPAWLMSFLFRAAGLRY